MDIAALSTVMSMGKVQAQASVAMASKVKDMAEANGAALVKMMEQSVAPHLGQNIDVKL